MTRPADAQLGDRILALFAEQLAVPDLGPEDDFFARGGTSLTAVRLLVRLRAVIDADISVVELFGNPSATSLARAVGSRRRHAAFDEADR